MKTKHQIIIVKKFYKMANNKKTWWEWILIWIGLFKIGNWLYALIILIYNNLHCK